MGLRFQKRIRIFKGLTINLSKTGTSLSVGGRGATVNFSQRGTKTTVGLPGSGLSYSTLHKNNEVEPQPVLNTPVFDPNAQQEVSASIPKSSVFTKLIWVAALLFIGFFLGKLIK